MAAVHVISGHVWKNPNDMPDLQHLHNVETRFYDPQAFLSLDFQYRDDVFELKQTFQD